LSELEELYSLLKWNSNPRTAEGKCRIFEILENMKKVLEHEWIKNIVGTRKKVRIVDLCSGGGVAGFALARLLVDRGVEVSLTLVDLRRKELFDGWLYAKEVFPEVEIDAVALDVKDIEKLGKSFDIALIWGLSLPHFSPWDFLKLLNAVRKCLSSDGILMIEECDRFVTIFGSIGYRYVIPEGRSEKPVVSIHNGYDYVTGMCRRIVVDLSTGRYVHASVCVLWTIPFIASFVWMFFEDIDVIDLSMREGVRTVVLGCRPRKGIDLDFVSRNVPTILRKR